MSPRGPRVAKGGQVPTATPRRRIPLSEEVWCLSDDRVDPREPSCCCDAIRKETGNCPDRTVHHRTGAFACGRRELPVLGNPRPRNWGAVGGMHVGMLSTSNSHRTGHQASATCLHGCLTEANHTSRLFRYATRHSYALIRSSATIPGNTSGVRRRGRGCISSC